MRIITWNIRSAANMTYVNGLSPDADIICLQEVPSGARIFDSPPTTRDNGLQVGVLTLSHRQWTVAFWPNNLTANGTMGVAALASPDVKEITCNMFTFSRRSASESRAMPFIQGHLDGEHTYRVYSYHSSSSGDNTNHATQVNADMTGLIDTDRTVVCGDFNLEASYLTGRLQSPNTLSATPEATRISSGRTIDYIVHRQSINPHCAIYPLDASDHKPVQFRL